ncbi:TPA: hypothetical protein DCZ46_00810 [Candidatus Campbellbacteria bacterium]|nr:MAG: protein of unknown function with transmembrane region [Candidatus Campbellbacteria bacterium GW2011_OD1_34_28]KKP75374.1 MAG: hypothetical protein UR74_C0001G0230 [Candidatus Campbellbacteria bacterium GW2011_GWD2_35_24]KKP76065.1 MAG: hypothetical protein UR75_C0001G0099 [Candidatus Campbellbacteria bacterium GW2011_GWC2_35_28]KKP77254.1 MAG: hypothetical protein UR76_C0001G0099 [Candidatus Campbellbacteria bacterium GW2011_GWC1_35_31]KKP79183.1 MAG: hypothetical protein UR79_C0001G009
MIRHPEDRLLLIQFLCVIGLVSGLIAFVLFLTPNNIPNQKSEEEKLSILRQVDEDPYYPKEKYIVLEIVKKEFISKVIARRVSDGFMISPLSFIEDLKAGDKVYVGAIQTKTSEVGNTQVVSVVIKKL